MPQNSVCVDFVSPHTLGGIAIYDAVIGLPAFLFMLFLGWKLRPSLGKLQRSQSYIMTTYYAFLWVVGVLNVLRCLVQVAQTESKIDILWNLLWILTRFGLVMLEVSVVVFLLQGYLTTGREALVNTLWVSGAVAGFEALIEVIYIFGAHVQLFLYGGDASSPIDDMRWSKWGFWLMHSLVFLAVYTCLLIIPHTKFRECLPAKPAFYRYVKILLVLNFVAALGSILLGSKLAGGYCVYGLASFLYYAVYPPLLYITFLAEFFRGSSEDLDFSYYSEMREAGFMEDGYD